MQNIESAIDDSRYYYDDIKSIERKESTNVVRKALGYDGQKDYMRSLGINEKSQFLFWKAMIQNKGTNFAINAFTNQTGLSGAEVARQLNASGKRTASGAQFTSANLLRDYRRWQATRNSE